MLVEPRNSLNFIYIFFLFSAKCKDLVPMNSTIMTDLGDAYKKMISSEKLTNAQERAKSQRVLKNKAMANKNAVYRASRSILNSLNVDCQPCGSGTTKKTINSS